MFYEIPVNVSWHKKLLDAVQQWPAKESTVLVHNQAIILFSLCVFGLVHQVVDSLFFGRWLLDVDAITFSYSWVDIL